MNHFTAGALLASLLIPVPALKAEASARLTVGDPAPAFKVSRWVKGEARPGLAKGEIHLVEFWATWCGPCRMSIPHLTEMAHTYKGKVNIIGVNVWESPAKGQSAEDVERNVDAFVKGMGATMDYAVARDTAEGHMMAAWLKAAGQNGIPAAFVVDAEGRIAWIGHPVAAGKVLDRLLAGGYDLKAAKVAHEREVAEENARMAKMAAQYKLLGEVKPAIDEARKAKKHAQVVKLVDAAVKKHAELAEPLAPARFVALAYLKKPAAKAIWEKAGKKGDRMGLVRAILAEDGLASSWYDAVVSEIQPLLKDESVHYGYFEFCAKALRLAGRPAEAAAMQEKCIAAGRAQKLPAGQIQRLEATLEQYRAQKG